MATIQVYKDGQHFYSEDAPELPGNVDVRLPSNGTIREAKALVRGFRSPLLPVNPEPLPVNREGGE